MSKLTLTMNLAANLIVKSFKQSSTYLNIAVITPLALSLGGTKSYVYTSLTKLDQRMDVKNRLINRLCPSIN